MTVIRPNSISGINSITANGGDINLFRADGTKADIPVVNNITGVAATFTGNLNVGGVLTYEDVTNVDSVGVITARQGIRIGAGKSIGSDGAAVVYYGDGSNLTGISAGPTLSSGSNDRVITATGANALLGEANLTFSGSVLNINGTTDDTPLMIDTTSNNGAHLRFRKDGSNQHFVGAGGGFGLGDKEDLSLRGYDNVLFSSGNNSTERLRITSQGTLFAKADGTAPVNQGEAGHYAGTGYNAGNALGFMAKRAIHVSDADTKGVGGMFLSHTRNVACNGTTYNMFTLHNREGTFIGDIYVGFSGNSSGAVRQYRFACLYNTHNLSSVQFNRRSNNDNLTVNIVSSNTAHFFQVIPTKSGGGTERVVMTIVGAMCGRNDGAGGDFYTVSYNS